MYVYFPHYFNYSCSLNIFWHCSTIFVPPLIYSDPSHTLLPNTPSEIFFLSYILNVLLLLLFIPFTGLEASCLANSLTFKPFHVFFCFFYYKLSDLFDYILWSFLSIQILLHFFAGIMCILPYLQLLLLCSFFYLFC